MYDQIEFLVSGTRKNWGEKGHFNTAKWLLCSLRLDCQTTQPFQYCDTVAYVVHVRLEGAWNEMSQKNKHLFSFDESQRNLSDLQRIQKINERSGKVMMSCHLCSLRSPDNCYI